MKPSIKDIAKVKWTKNWSGKFSLLIVSYAVEAYARKCDYFFKANIPNLLYIHKKGITICYLSLSDFNSFGKNLANQIMRDNTLAEKWSDEVRDKTDKVKEIISRPIKSFLELDNYLSFYEIFLSYEPHQIAVKIVADYLSPSLAKKYNPVFRSTRIYTEFLYDAVEKFLEKFAKIIGEKEDCAPHLILNMNHKEIVHYLKTGILPDKEDLEKRYNLSALYAKGNEEHFLTDNIVELEDLIAKQRSEITGRPAYPGKVQGICRIIPDPRGDVLFNKGDILVTNMTRPIFIKFMKKAAAIVTDAGGILCHAAIVAREMKKPCITGTESATKILKDGDLVEVDADKGVVRKLK
jgi:phosphohistidine swiveling domain-containing protein